MSSTLLKNFLKKFKLNESTISMVLGALVVIVVGGLVINYFRNTNRLKQTGPVPVSPESTQPIELPISYKVVAGDSLWKIAEKFYGSGYNWVDIVQENSLNHPNSIVIDQELTIPKVEVREPLVAEKPATKPFVEGEPITGDSYTVIKDDCLWKIAIRAYGDGYQWVKIARENNLAKPGLIHPGNILKLPR